MARTQHGLVTRRQCELAGYGEVELRGLTRKHGPWVIVRVGVYCEREVWLAADDAERARLYDRAAHLVMVTDHVMSHDSAARALDVPLLRPRHDLVHVTREGVGGGRTEGGVKHHLTRCELGPVVDVSGMTVTNPARTAIDLAREHGLRAGVVALDHVRAHGARLGHLARELEVMHSWPYVRRARQAVDLSDPRAESPLESLTRLLLVDMGIVDIDLQWPIIIRGQLYWTDLRVGCHIIEADGLGKYLGPEDGGTARSSLRDVLSEERRRQADICGEGLGMSRVGWDDVIGPGRARAMDRLQREIVATQRRFGRELPEHLARQAARVRAERPRRRSA